MRFFSSLLWGGVSATVFWAFIEYRHPNILFRNIGRPIKDEFSKDDVDVTRIFSLLMNEMENVHGDQTEQENITQAIAKSTGFQCCLCLYLLVQPISFPCGHNVCKKCIYNLDFARYCHACPSCKTSFLVPIQSYRVNLILDEMIRRSYPEAYSSNLTLKKEPPIQKNVPKELLLNHIYEVMIAKLRALCQSVGGVLPLLTFILAIMLWCKFTRRYDRKYRLTIENFKRIQNFLNNLGINTANTANNLYEKDVQKLIYSRVIKYFLSRYS